MPLISQAHAPYVIPNRQRVSRSGDALMDNGPLRLSRDPVEPREAATKGYADIVTGGAPFGTNVVPNVVDSWYTHNMPGAPVNGGTGTDFGDWSIMAPMFVGQEATWSRLSLTHIGGFQPKAQFGVWSLEDATLLHVEALWVGDLEIPIGTQFTQGTYGVPLVSTNTNWIGLALHAHGNGGGWFTFDVDKNGASVGQYNYKTWGYDATMALGVSGIVLATLVGGDGGTMPTDPDLWFPYNYHMPSIGIQLHSVP